MIDEPYERKRPLFGFNLCWSRWVVGLTFRSPCDYDRDGRIAFFVGPLSVSIKGFQGDF